MGKTGADTAKVLDRAREFLEQSRKHRLNGEFTQGYTDAQIYSGGLRITTSPPKNQ